MEAVIKAHPISKPREIPGNKAIWVGIFAELTEFALMFFVYFLARIHYPDDFQQGPQQLSTLAGVLNTLALLTSGYFVVLAVYAIRRDDVSRTLWWLSASFVVGCLYPFIKYHEIIWNLEHGVDGGQGSVFQLSYYYLTLNHLVHVFWGLIGLAWVMFRTYHGAYNAENHTGLIAFASYWHATDLIWLMIFPLFYVLT